MKHIAVLMLLALTLCIPSAWLVYSNYQKELKTEENRAAKLLEVKTIASLRQDYPRKAKGRKMATKIARGSTGQADFEAEICTGLPDYEEYHLEVGWSIASYDYEGIAWNNIKNPDGSTGDGYSGEPGWNATPEGVITVPANTKPGSYYMVYLNGSCLKDEDEIDYPGLIYGTTQISYFFEVPCVKIELTATRIN